ncbi:MAG: 2-dehydropantoate 2-reductase [Hydrogenophaga sp.]|uniref:2-dehydropantoate 2-reductase n=1 Tax=Hydrogenophaga sp. TaxID=1904254 RepID=UPI000B2DF706|nr:2-dehydropantoate 2-reductase [Hydrogenophaga sp.]MCG2656281.1 2-dehydropantoate 2-reductase [Hydrogenophaga sp.]
MSPSPDLPAKAPPGPVLVMGAGSVGCFVGGCLQAAGVRVDFVGRSHRLAALQASGLQLTDQDGRDQRIPPARLRLHGQVPAGLAPSLVLLCVKSGATADSARELQERLPAGTTVLSLQNGMQNAQLASQAAPGLNVMPGMVAFNVAHGPDGRFHRGTAGQLAARDTPALRLWQPHFERAGLPLVLHTELRNVQWGKLLLNLNNPVNALSGLPLRAQLQDAARRREFAGLVEEALDVMAHAGVRPARMTPLPWRLLVRVLRWPTPVFKVVARRMLRMDHLARSSMADDLAHGRPTEIDELCGEVVRLAGTVDRPAPLNSAMVTRIHSIKTAHMPPVTQPS